VNLPFFIAKRYLFSRRKKNFINIISMLSVVGVAFSTAALVIVLSVFNGLEQLLYSLNNSFDPEIKITASTGKSFELTPEMLEKIKKTKGVKVVTEVIEDYAYVRYRDASQVVRMKGVGDNFLEQERIPEDNIAEGTLAFKKDSIPYAVMGMGVKYALGVAVDQQIPFPLQVYYINNVSASTIDVSRLYTQRNILPGGVFSIVQNFDENFILVPLDFMQDLLRYENKRTSLEVKTEAGVDPFETERRLEQLLGEKFSVLNHEEQHEDLYKLLRMEKLFTFLALTLLTIIGSVNIFFSLMMLALDKRKDISILSSLGASAAVIRKVFLLEGFLIAGIGAVAGLVFGGIFCLLQMKYSFISMGMESAVSSGYPVQVEIMDFLVVLFVVAIISLLISIRPAQIASRMFDLKQL